MLNMPEKMSQCQRKLTPENPETVANVLCNDKKQWHTSAKSFRPFSEKNKKSTTSIE